MAGMFSWPVRVYWEDTDAGGVVYYANYLKFLERARSEWLRALGFEQPDLIARHGGVFVVRRVEADYLLPARFNDALEVKTEIETSGNVSLVMRQTVLRQDESGSEAVLLTARVKLVWVNEVTFKPAKIPDEILKSFGE